jgi:hypothetical protein
MAARRQNPSPPLHQENRNSNKWQGKAKGLVPMIVNSTVWTTENCNRLRQWWEQDGLSCGQISACFGQIGWKITRNSIISKVHRLKLKAPENKKTLLRELRVRRMKVQSAAKLREASKPKIPPPSQPKVTIMMDNHVSNAVLLKQSQEGQCKAVLGYIRGRCEDAVYCGEPTIAVIRNGREVQSSWCKHHHSIYTVESKR